MIEGRPGRLLRSTTGSGDSGDAVVANDSGGSGGGGGSGDSAVYSGQQTKKTLFGTSRGSGGSGGGGGGGGSGGASLFDMVMSRASCSSQSSNGGGGMSGGFSGGSRGAGGGSIGSNGDGAGNGDGGGGGGGQVMPGRNRLSVAATTGARAEGGKPVVASSLSGMLGSMRGQQPALPPQPMGNNNKATEDDGLAGGVRRGGVNSGGAGAGGSSEDWMAINLEKLSNFRVPETRMGFPDGAREVGMRTAKKEDSKFCGRGGGEGAHECA